MFFRKKKEELLRVDPQQLKHIAFIMDGNGRWATARGLPRESGHVRGADNFRKIVMHCRDIGIRTVTVYAFSTENWQRPKKEVDALMRLLTAYFDEAIRDAEKNQLRYILLGDRTVLSPALQEKAEKLTQITRDMPYTLNLAINYGGRDEIVHAVNQLIGQGKTQVSKADISANLYTAASPDPDLVVRTGGEMRISNFLLWQSAYAEYYFTGTLWPDLTEREVDEAVRDFLGRRRRYGGL